MFLYVYVLAFKRIWQLTFSSFHGADNSYSCSTRSRSRTQVHTVRPLNVSSHGALYILYKLSFISNINFVCVYFYLDLMRSMYSTTNEVYIGVDKLF